MQKGVQHLVSSDDSVLFLVKRRSPLDQDGGGVEGPSCYVPRLARNWRNSQYQNKVSQTRKASRKNPLQVLGDYVHSYISADKFPCIWSLSTCIHNFCGLLAMQTYQECTVLYICTYSTTNKSNISFLSRGTLAQTAGQGEKRISSCFPCHQATQSPTERREQFHKISFLNYSSKVKIMCSKS